MEIIGSRFGNDGNDATACATELGVIAVSLDLEFLNGVDGGIDQNGAVRSYVNIVGAIDQEQVGIGSAAADGNVCAPVETFLS